MNTVQNDQPATDFKTEIRVSEMIFKDMTRKLKQLNIHETRQISDDYCELVLFNKDMEKWNEIISENLGPPIKPAGVLTTDDILALTHDLGEIVDHQTLFKKDFDDSSVLAMFWPWQDNEHTTLIMALSKNV